MCVYGEKMCVYGEKMCVYGEMPQTPITSLLPVAEIQVFNAKDVCLWGIKCV